MQKTVMVVDDEKNIVDILSFNLKKEGYNVIAAFDGGQALELAQSCNPDLILLDLMLPVMDGLSVCKKIRENDYSVPIIMLTAREEETDKVMGLEIGADDYITKPFSVREVMARVKANMRRIAQPENNKSQTQEKKGIEIDLINFAAYKNGQMLDLTQREFELLNYLYSQPGKIVSREELLKEVWRYNYLGDPRAVDVAVRRLREKIEDNSASPEYIITKRGMGYYFDKH